MTVEELREAGNPYWVDVLAAGEFLGLDDKTVLHAGPPIEFGRMCAGHKRSMVNACLFEGWAKTEDESARRPRLRLARGAFPRRGTLRRRILRLGRLFRRDRGESRMDARYALC